MRAGTPRHLALAAGRGLIANSRGLADGYSEAELLCAPSWGRCMLKGKQIGPGRHAVGASTAWDSDCGLSTWSGVISGAAGSALVVLR